MNDMMKFPDTVEEFMEQYKITDTEQIYTNGTALVPIFRMKQWFEHLPPAEPEDAVMLDKETILQAGYKNREVEFRIGGRLFRVREVAQ